VRSADPYVVRFKINPLVWLEPVYALPVSEKICWEHLSFTNTISPGGQQWTAMVRCSLRKLTDADGEYLEEILLKQKKKPREYILTESDLKKLKLSLINTKDSQVAVSIPENEDVLQESPRESTEIQALLARIGERMEQMDLKIWIPHSDRQRVLDLWKPKNRGCILDQLPLNYDDVTLRTIENIDVLWIHGRSIIRAFEVEHTTSIYSGILRMADLMALQPNLSIRAHIVAPESRKSKVFQEITRPVFALLEKGPLAEACTYLSYGSIKELSKETMLKYMSDCVLEEYEEYAQDADA
jgi:hypothetical protein